MGLLETLQVKERKQKVEKEQDQACALLMGHI